MHVKASVIVYNDVDDGMIVQCFLLIAVAMFRSLIESAEGPLDDKIGPEAHP